MRSGIGLVLFLVFGGFLAGGCAPQTEVLKLYDDPARPSKTFKRLLIVDISSNRGQRQLFEDEIVSRLRREDVEATASYTLLDASNGLLQDDINRVSKEINADGILVTHIASVDTTVERVEGRERIESTCRRGDPVDYFLYDHKVLREPDSVRLAHTVIVISNLYDVQTRKRLWTIQSTCFEKASMSAVLQDESSAIVRQLLIDQLI